MGLGLCSDLARVMKYVRLEPNLSLHIRYSHERSLCEYVICSDFISKKKKKYIYVVIDLHNFHILQITYSHKRTLKNNIYHPIFHIQSFFTLQIVSETFDPTMAARTII
jgi:hypothetical protein